MATAEWDCIPWKLIGPASSLSSAELDFNVLTNTPFDTQQYYFVVDRTRCQAGPTPVRATKDPVPQADGDILHRFFKPGYSIKMALELYKSPDLAAMGYDLRVMWDTLMYWLDALFYDSGRLIWTPTGADDRMWDDIRLLEWPTQAFDGSVTSAEFVLASELPYAIHAAEESPNTIGTSPANYTNIGTTATYPVFKVHAGSAPLGYFEIHNLTTGVVIIYDSTFPGATAVPTGKFAEINTFRNTVYRGTDGGPGNETNLKPGISVAQSDFFTLVPGVNSLKMVYGGGGGSPHTDILWNSAFA